MNYNKELTITRERDAKAFAAALGLEYPSYRFEAIKPTGKSLWRIAVYCKATGAYLSTYDR